MESRNLNRLEFSGDWDLERLLARPGWERVAVRVAGTLRLWAQRARRRRELRALMEHEERFFRDIGIPRAEVYAAGRKWFWQA